MIHHTALFLALLSAGASLRAQRLTQDLTPDLTQELGLPLVVEAEDFAHTKPAPPKGARGRNYAWASGRAALVRFPLSEETAWKLPEVEAGPHELWLRYTSRRVCPLTWSLDGAEWATTECPPTAGLSGRDSWAWHQLGTAAFNGKEITLRVQGAPMRPDCFLLRRPADGPPVWPPASVPTELTAEDVDKLAALPARSTPPWLESAAAIELPAWIEDTRVALHTRLSVAWTDKPLFTAAEARASELGAPAITRFAKSHGGDCFWPSSTGSVADWVAAIPEDEPDPIEAMAARARSHDLGFVAYLRHGEDGPLARAHPEWVCRDLEGRPIEFAGHARLCFHSPYGDVIAQRIHELADRGVQGIYLDETHQPLDGCWCDWTQRAFTEETGLPMPTSRLKKDPLYRRFLGFSEDALARELWRWRAAVRAEHPAFVFLVSTGLQPNLMGPRPTLRLGLAGDVIKTEFDLGTRPNPLPFLESHPELDPVDAGTLLALGWVQSRDGAFGRPAHVWIHALKSRERWQAATAAVVASGCLANLDQSEATMASSDHLAPAFQLGKAMGAALARSRPWRTVAIHLPERARNATVGSRERGWSLNMGPATAAFAALLAKGYPTSVLSDDLLAAGHLDGIDLLFIPNPEGLEPKQRAALLPFLKRGGVVIRQDPAKLLEACAERPWPYHLDLPPEAQAHHFIGEDGAHLIALSNDPEWINKSARGAPPRVTEAKLFLQTPVSSVTFVGAAGSTTANLEGSSEVALPPFQHGLVIRIQLDGQGR
ncbi:MAG: hypothetical protein ACJAQ3_001587 [Planctomycetota bacterium]